MTPGVLARLLARSLKSNVSIENCCVFLCIADHYEPMWGNAPMHVQLDRVERWVKEYPKSVEGITDSRGQVPQHTFFYPIEEYDERLVEKIAALCRAGFGALEFHLHHDGDSPQQLRDRLETAKLQFHDRHGALAKNDQGQVTYGFVHGNWALCNSRPDGRWCGVNDELTILRETGCYADFTMPAAPDPAQSRMMNSIYYATSDASQPRGHDRGIAAAVGKQAPENGLLLIQGPLMLDWTRRKAGVLPSLENGDLHGSFPPTMSRFRQWLHAGVSVEGKPNWIFIKLHTHGAPEKNAHMLLGEPMRRFREHLAEHAHTLPGFRYSYVTAREMAKLVHVTETDAPDPSN